MVKTTTKKTTAKTVKTVKPVKKTDQISLARWLFVPDIKQGIWAWLGRAGLFLAAIFALTLLITNTAVLEIMKTDIKRTIEVALVIYVIGIFAFMPRRFLDKTSFVAAFWSLTLWAGLFATGLWSMDKYYPNGSSALFILLAFSTMFLLFAIFGSIVCYARNIGIKKSALLLSFPLGWTFFEYSGFFLPSKGTDRTIAIKYKWYDKFIDSILNTKSGQIILALLAVTVLALNPSPWGLFIALFFAGLYAIRGKNWILENITKLSWVVSVFNILAIVISIHYIATHQMIM